MLYDSYFKDQCWFLYYSQPSLPGQATSRHRVHEADSINKLYGNTGSKAVLHWEHIVTSFPFVFLWRKCSAVECILLRSPTAMGKNTFVDYLVLECSSNSCIDSFSFCIYTSMAYCSKSSNCVHSAYFRCRVGNHHKLTLSADYFPGLA